MIKENKTQMVLMFGSFILCFFLIFGVGINVFRGNHAIGFACALLAIVLLAVHGSSMGKLSEKNELGRPILYDDLQNEKSFQVIEEIGSGYHRVAPAGYDPKTVKGRIVYGLPQSVATAGCVFFKRYGEVFLKAQPTDQEVVSRLTSEKSVSKEVSFRPFPLDGTFPVEEERIGA